MQTADVETRSRYLAAKVLGDIIKNKAFSNISINNALDSSAMNREDKSFCHALIHISLEHLKILEHIVSLFAKTKPDYKTTAFLYIGIAQILYMDKVPDNAACNETVKAAKELVDNRRAGFINGILRNVCRNRDEILQNLQYADEDIRRSVDKSIINLLKSQYPENYDKILDSFFTELPLNLRINTIKYSISDVRNKFTETAAVFEINKNTACIKKGSSNILKLLDKGLFFVQGAAAQTVSEIADCRGGMLVIDTCACPGGKSFAAAIAMNNTGKIIALDIHKNKIPLINKTASILGINIIETAVHDSTIPMQKYIGKADRVICDVPCTALGLLSSKPELRYKSMENNDLLYKTQKRILQASTRYLKDGGVLVYSTCTINKIENEETVNAFLLENPDFILEAQKTFLPFEGTEGFYTAKIIKQPKR